MSEQNELAECEAKIERGLQTFYEVGQALINIRDKQLYREHYNTFEAYCQDRWQMSHQRAYQLMGAAEVVENVQKFLHPPQTESHTTPLIKLEPEQQLVAWEVVQQTAPGGKVTAAHVKSVVDILKTVTLTGAIDGGEGTDIPIVAATLDHLKAAVTEETYERLKRQEIHVQENNYKRDAKSNRLANEYEPQGYDACQTPAYAIDPLLPYLDRSWTIWEPAAGEGLLVDALSDSNFEMIIGSDILTGSNFFEFEPDQEWDCIVTNPPFSLKYRWMERCYQLGERFALLLPVETLGAKTAHEMFRVHGIEVIFMDKRINFKMPNKGWDGGGAQFPVAWFTWGLNIGSQMTFARLNHDQAGMVEP